MSSDDPQCGATTAGQRLVVNRRGAPRLEAGGLVLLLAGYLLLVWRFWFVIDDAFISFRYARNLAAGHGLRYNLLSEVPVEGYSNFLWVLLCAAMEKVGLEVTFWPLVVSVICGVVLLYLLWRTLRRDLELSAPAAWLATVLLASFPPFALWSTSGLATVPFALCVFLTFQRLVLRKDGPDAWGGAAAGVALCLIRLEGVGWFVVIVLLALLRVWRERRDWRPVLLCAVLVLVVYGGYFAWRYHYYGLPLPNTAYAKGQLDAQRLRRGLNYVVSFGLTFVGTALLLPALAAGLRRRRGPRGLATAALALGFPVYAVLVTGDFMPMGRFLIAGLAPAAVLVGWLLDDLLRGGVGRRVLAGLLATAGVVLGLLPAWNIHVVPRDVREKFRFRFNIERYDSEFEQWRTQARNAARWGRRGLALRYFARLRGLDHPRPTYVVGAIGASGYYCDFDILDKNGLVTPEVARRSVAADEPLRSPGHDKHVERDFFIPWRPTVLDAQLLEATTPADAAEVCVALARLLREEGLSRQYVVDCVRVPAEELELPYGPPPRGDAFLVTWRLIGEDQTPQRAWSTYRAMLRELRGG